MAAQSFEELNQRPLPAWWDETPFGIFIHWGAYAVPAWAEPIGPLGTFEPDHWMRHNPYAEWYWNTIQIDGSPAQQHHQEVWGGRPYDDFLDLWQAEHFDPADWVALFKRAGAGYVIPTTKHHDGIALWDAPETNGRNTVARGPQRDLVGDLASAARAEGMRFGTYYSGGLDWFMRPGVHAGGTFPEPADREYGAYAGRHAKDLVDRYAPDILWGDITWPVDARNFDTDGLGDVFNHFYERVPEGVVNDRFGPTHHSFRTSEYEAGREHETTEAWENCRGIGYSFGYNQVEDASHYLSGAQAAQHLVDIVSRGGHFLLNVGPCADGTIVDLQRRCLEDLATWMDSIDRSILRARPSSDVVEVEGDAWARPVTIDGRRAAFVARNGEGRASVKGVELPLPEGAEPVLVDLD